MKLLRPLVVVAFLFILVGAGAIWWNSPAKADMAEYAPADSLVYIEINSVHDIANAIRQSEVLRPFLPLIGVESQPSRGWTVSAVRAGVGPTAAVISSRAQVALAVVNLDTAEQDDSLRVKPEFALIVETHTSKWRMKSSAVSAIQQLAQFAYGGGTCTERSGESGYIDCIDPGSSRKIVGAIDGSVVIVGNSERSVESCLEVRRGKRPSLRTDPELARARASLKSESALSFGYVSQANAAKLVSWGAPLLFGKAPGDRQIEELLTKSAGKIFRGVAWTSRPLNGGIEDRYQIALEPEVTKRLEPAFDTGEDVEDFWKLLPDSFRSLTVYRSKDPRAAWSSLDSALAVKLDAVSSVFFGALLRSGLSAYGIEEPREVLGNLASPVITFRPILGDDSLFVARVAKEKELREALASSLLEEGKGQVLNGIPSEVSKEKEFTAVLIDGFVIIGKTESVLVYLTQLRNSETVTAQHLEKLKLANRENGAAIVTYSNERSSTASVIRALARFSRQQLSDDQLAVIQDRFESNVAVTESSLSTNGIERKTQSAFGQFGSLLSVAEADTSRKPR